MMKGTDVSSLSKSDLDWMVSRKTGNLGGAVLKASQIRKLRGLLKEKGIILIIDGDLRSIKQLFKPIMGFDKVDDLFRYMSSRNPPLVGGFDAITKQFILSKKATEIIAFHELAHLKHMEELGEVVYISLSELDKEMYVWKQIFETRKLWTDAEFLESLKYINDIRVDDYGLEPLIVKL
jgi:zincin-like metallopeptidase toxin 4 of polymorphic toxin system